MSSSLTNSDKNCRQTPQGVVKECSWKATTATALNSVKPALTALQSAFLSAQTDGLYAAFSTLHPPTIAPLANRIAAPTLNLLYGLEEN